jgi:hypothetical protein
VPSENVEIVLKTFRAFQRRMVFRIQILDSRAHALRTVGMEE